MHKTIAVLLGIVCFLPVMAKAGGAETDATDASDVKTLFFNHDDRVPVADPTQSPWDAIGQLETASGNLCTATLISPHIALTARSLPANAAERKTRQGGCAAFCGAKRSMAL